MADVSIPRFKLRDKVTLPTIEASFATVVKTEH